MKTQTNLFIIFTIIIEGIFVDSIAQKQDSILLQKEPLGKMELTDSIKYEWVKKIKGQNCEEIFFNSNIQKQDSILLQIVSFGKAGLVDSIQNEWVKRIKGRTREEIFLEDYGIELTPPKGCKILGTDFFSVAHESVYRGNSSYYIESPDGEFVAHYFGPRPFAEKKSSIDNTEKGDKYYASNTLLGDYRHYIRHELRCILKTEQFSIKDHVTYYSYQEAERKFNADTIVGFEVPLFETEPYRGKYNKCYSLYIQKNGRCFVNIGCFFTKKGWENRKKYLKELDKSIWYKDDFEK